MCSGGLFGGGRAPCGGENGRELDAGPCRFVGDAGAGVEVDAVLEPPLGRLEVALAAFHGTGAEGGSGADEGGRDQRGEGLELGKGGYAPVVIADPGERPDEELQAR
jgi:hypothetical protein